MNMKREMKMRIEKTTTMTMPIAISIGRRRRIRSWAPGPIAVDQCGCQCPSDVLSPPRYRGSSSIKSTIMMRKRKKRMRMLPMMIISSWLSCYWTIRACSPVAVAVAVGHDPVGHPIRTVRYCRAFPPPLPQLQLGS